MTAAWSLTPVNGIKMKPNGRFVVYVRVLGDGTARIVTESARSWPEALAAREQALAGRQPSAIGLCRMPCGWNALVRWHGHTYCLGTYQDEAEAARVRCAFDTWAAYQPRQAVNAALQQYHARGRSADCCLISDEKVEKSAY